VKNSECYVEWAIWGANTDKGRIEMISRIDTNIEREVLKIGVWCVGTRMRKGRIP
jgi:hypothetical protein